MNRGCVDKKLRQKSQSAEGDSHMLDWSRCLLRDYALSLSTICEYKICAPAQNHPRTSIQVHT